MIRWSCIWSYTVFCIELNIFLVKTDAPHECNYAPIS